jgi:hypothetical protein
MINQRWIDQQKTLAAHTKPGPARDAIEAEIAEAEKKNADEQRARKARPRATALGLSPVGKRFVPGTDREVPVYEARGAESIDKIAKRLGAALLARSDSKTEATIAITDGVITCWGVSNAR